MANCQNLFPNEHAQPLTGLLGELRPPTLIRGFGDFFSPPLAFFFFFFNWCWSSPSGPGSTCKGRQNWIQVSEGWHKDLTIPLGLDSTDEVDAGRGLWGIMQSVPSLLLHKIACKAESAWDMSNVFLGNGWVLAGGAKTVFKIYFSPPCNTLKIFWQKSLVLCSSRILSEFQFIWRVE